MLEGFPKWLRDIFQTIPDFMEHVPFVAKLLNQTSLSLQGGNMIVYREIGGEFARFGAYFYDVPEANETLLEEYLAGFNMTWQCTQTESAGP